MNHVSQPICLDWPRLALSWPSPYPNIPCREVDYTICNEINCPTNLISKELCAWNIFTTQCILPSFSFMSNIGNDFMCFLAISEVVLTSIIGSVAFFLKLKDRQCPNYGVSFSSLESFLSTSSEQKGMDLQC